MIPLSRIVTVSTPTFDPDAGVRLQLLDDGSLADLSRRATVTPTLDGGVVVDDMGVFASDRELVLRARVTEAERTQIQNLHTNNPVLHVSTDQGFFAVVSLTVTFSSGEVTWDLRVTARLDPV